MPVALTVFRPIRVYLSLLFLLRYTVLCMVESCFISYVYRDLYVLGDNANLTYICLDLHLN